MIKRHLKLPLLILTLLIAGLGAAALATDFTPVNSVLNPKTETLYFADNLNHVIRIGTRNKQEGLTNGWLMIYKTDPFDGKCLGLAVTPDGNKLYASISNGSKSTIRVFNAADGNLIKDITGPYFTLVPSSSPAGMAIAGGRLFVADQNGRVLVFNTSIDEYIKGFTEPEPDICGVAAIVTNSNFAKTTYKIFVSRNTADGIIYVFTYTTGIGGTSISCTGTIDHAALQRPTQLKAITGNFPDQNFIFVERKLLYAAVNGANQTEDIAVFDANPPHNYLGAIRSGNEKNPSLSPNGRIVFDFSPSGSILVYKKTLDAFQKVNQLYFLYYSDFKGDGSTVTAYSIEEKRNPDIPLNTIGADGLALSFDKSKAALTYSPKGDIQVYDPECAANIVKLNRPPQIDRGSLKQFEYKSGDAIQAGGETDENRVKASCVVWEDDLGDEVTVTFYYRKMKEWQNILDDWILVKKKYISDGKPKTVEASLLPAFPDLYLADGNYEWYVEANDNVNLDSWDKTEWHYGEVNDVDFIVNAVNDPPNPFGKLAPPDKSEEGVDVKLKWEAKGDPDALDKLTYRVVVYKEGNDEAVINVEPLAASEYIIQAGKLTAGTTYEWNISATDGKNIVWANGADNAYWKFKYVSEGKKDPANPPKILKTSPADKDTGVSTDAPIVITFSESMVQDSVEKDFPINNPNVSNLKYEWNLDQTEVKITHDLFVKDTEYIINVSGNDLDNQALIPGPVPNPFKFTTGSGVVVIISDVSIKRDNDAKGSNVTISWKTLPLHSNKIKIYYKDNDFSPIAGPEWKEITKYDIIKSNGDLDTYTDPDAASLVGSGTSRYYKIIPAGKNLTNEDLKSDVVGKFDLDVGVESEKFFISLPLVPSSKTLSNIFGGQALSLDTLFIFDAQANPTDAITYNGNNWVEFAPGIKQINSMELGYSYGFATTMSRFITVVGMVKDSNNSRPIEGLAAANWIATAYPMESSVQNIGLENSSIGSSAGDAGTIYHFDSNANLLDDASGMASHTKANEWTDLGAKINSTVIKPGKGYMFTEPGANITWTQPRPY